MRQNIFSHKKKTQNAAGIPYTKRTDCELDVSEPRPYLG